jgi:hypothetical protein
MLRDNLDVVIILPTERTTFSMKTETLFFLPAKSIREIGRVIIKAHLAKMK